MCDDAWSNVKVVEGEITDRVFKIMVAVEHGARAVITGQRVPWKTSRLTPEVAARAAMAAHLTHELSRK